MRQLLFVLVLVFVTTSLGLADDIGEKDTLRLDTFGNWLILTAFDSTYAVDLWTWADDDAILAASIPLKLNISGAYYDAALHDSFVVVDTIIKDAAWNPMIPTFRRSVVKNDVNYPSGQTDEDFGFNGVLFGGVNILTPPLFNNAAPTKLGDMVLKIRHPDRLPHEFTIEIDSAFYPPAGVFKYSPPGSPGHIPHFNKVTISVINFLACPDLCVEDSDLDCYADPGFGDSICPEDNCPYVYNPLQQDSDADGVGNVCDQCPGFDDNLDNDQDEIPDGCDNCLSHDNPDQEDSDEDGVGDSCDICPGFDDYDDNDGDSVPDGCDNCPYNFNPEQTDSDEDGYGDECDNFCGDPDGSGNVDIDDIVFIINYIFAGGPAPSPPVSGDPNCSGNVDMDDIVYIINYMFYGGPEPCDTDGDGIPDC